MSEGLIVGIGSSKRVGKDTAAKVLERELGFRRVGFADQLKALALEANPLITTNVQAVNVGTGAGHLAHVVKGLGWDQAKDIHGHVREFLQNLGAGARKVFGDDFWIRQVLDEVGDDLVVIPDVRYLNEAETIEAAGGVLIRIERPGFRGQGHRSETDLDDYDWPHTIENNGTVAELEAEVLSIVKSHLEAKAAELKPKVASKKAASKKAAAK